MADKIKELFHKVLEWWNHFSTKQKTFIISAGAGVILALAILVTVLTRPQYTLLRSCDTTKEASEIADIIRFRTMPIRLPSIRSSSHRQICCWPPIIFRRIHIPSIT